MISTTVKNTLLAIFFFVSLTYCTPHLTVNDRDRAKITEEVLSETIPLLANTPDNQIECFQGKSGSNIALQLAIYNEARANDLFKREDSAPRVNLNVIIEQRLKLYDVINIYLKAAVSILETEIQEEKKKFSACMGEITQDSFRAFEQVNFFYPRQVTAGTAVDPNWFEAMDSLASEISQVQLHSNSDIGSSETTPPDDPDSSYRKARNIYLRLTDTFEAYANTYEKNMSSRMQATWACGLTTSAAVAMLSWTRAPSQLGTTSFEQGTELINLINGIFHDIKNGCTAHIGEEGGESALPSFLSSYDTCNDWRQYYRSTFRACKPTTKDTPASNSSDIARQNIRSFANSVELTPQTRIQLVLLYQALNGIRIEIAKQSLANRPPSPTIEDNHKALLGKIIQISMTDVISLLRYDPLELSPYRMGCFAGSGENGECNDVLHLIDEMNFDKSSDKELFTLILRYAQASQGNPSLENSNLAAATEKEIMQHPHNLTARSKEAEIHISKIVFGDETALQRLHDLNISLLALHTREGLNAEDSSTKLSLGNETGMTKEISRNRNETDKLIRRQLVDIAHAQTVLTEKTLLADSIKVSADQRDAYYQKRVLLIASNQTHHTDNDAVETCLTRLKKLTNEKDRTGRYKYFPYFTDSKQRTVVNTEQARKILGKHFDADIIASILNDKHSAIIFMPDKNNIAGFYTASENSRPKSDTISCISDLLEDISKVACNTMDKDGNFQITLNEVLLAEDTFNGKVHAIGENIISNNELETPHSWDKDRKGNPIDLSSSISGHNHGNELFREIDTLTTSNNGLGYVILYEPSDTGSCHQQKEDLESWESVIVSASGRAIVQMDSLWGCTNSTSPEYNEKICFDACWDFHDPASALTSDGELDRGNWTGTTRWCRGVCEKATEHPESAYAKCLEFIQWKNDPQAKEKSWSFPVRYLPLKMGKK